MSTHAAIIEQLSDGSYRGIYCHADGYISGAGKILVNHYSDKDKVSHLTLLGDIGSLREEVFVPDGEFHTFQKPHPLVTIAYHRDRLEDWSDTSYTEKKSLNDMINHFSVYYNYVFINNEWYKDIDDSDAVKYKDYISIENLKFIPIRELLKVE